MKNKKNNLDEMQELKALKIEHNGCWLFYSLLIISILVQMVFYGGKNPEAILGECVVLIIACLYLTVSFLKNGIWDRKLKPTVMTNIIVSSIASIIMAVIWGVISFNNYHKLIGSIATAVFMFIFVFSLCFILLSLYLYLYKKRVEKAEKDSE